MPSTPPPFRGALLAAGLVLGGGCGGDAVGAPPEDIVLAIDGARLRPVAPGDSVALGVRLMDRVTGSDLPLSGAPAWSSADPAIATITAAGVAHAHAAGYTRLRAALDGRVDSIWVRVLGDAPRPPLFTFEFDDAVPVAQRAQAARAAARWSRIVPGVLDTVLLALSASPCGVAAPWPRAVSGPEAGVRILVVRRPIAAPAGTVVCHRRTDGRSAVAAIIVSSSIEYDWYSADHWATVWLHELGHALGLAADLVVPPLGPLTGSAMLAGFAHDFGRTATALTYDRNAHWIGVPGDIMDGRSGVTGSVIGRATVGRLLDMGYPADLRQAGPFDLPPLLP